MPNRPYASIPSVRELSDFDRAFDRAFSIVAFGINRHLIDHMLRSARLVGNGDPEALIVWGVLAHQNVTHLMPPGSVPTAVLDERGRLPDSDGQLRPLRLRDIAAITRIPRETVRRKLHLLERERYVQRTGEGWVVSAERVEPELREFTRESVWRLLAVADEVRAALRDADAPAQEDPPAARRAPRRPTSKG